VKFLTEIPVAKLKTLILFFFSKIKKKTKKNAIDINITQMMVGKQWVKR